MSSNSIQQNQGEGSRARPRSPAVYEHGTLLPIAAAPAPDSDTSSLSDDNGDYADDLSLSYDLIDFTTAAILPLDDVWAEIEDIGPSILEMEERPSNTSGHFCDLFIGVHTTEGKVALKRPRISQDDYTVGDIRVSSLNGGS